MSQFDELYKVLETYFDALYYCDIDKIRETFHPKAIYATADERPFLYRDMAEYVEVISQRKSPASHNEPRHDFIDAIEFAGSNTARARVRCSIGSRDFIDFLTLIREGGRWRIIAKVFQIIEKSEKH